MSASGNITDVQDASAEQAAGPTSSADRHLAHELGNLLDAAMRSVWLASDRLGALGDAPRDAQAVHEANGRLQTAHEAMQRMAMLLRRWMRRADADLWGLYWHEATIARTVEYAVRMVRPVAESRRVTIQTQIAEDAGALSAGPLYPVLANGLRNAVEAMEHPGRITVSVRREADRITLTITDEGAGVDEDLARDADGQPLPGTSTKGDGRGLGLDLSRRIIEQLGGTLRLEDIPGGGAQLTAQIPADAVAGKQHHD